VSGEQVEGGIGAVATAGEEDPFAVDVKGAAEAAGGEVQEFGEADVTFAEGRRIPAVTTGFFEWAVTAECKTDVVLGAEGVHDVLELIFVVGVAVKPGDQRIGIAFLIVFRDVDRDRPVTFEDIVRVVVGCGWGASPGLVDFAKLQRQEVDAEVGACRVHGSGGE
jgi:hypothetical protein